MVDAAKLTDSALTSIHIQPLVERRSSTAFKIFSMQCPRKCRQFRRYLTSSRSLSAASAWFRDISFSSPLFPPRVLSSYVQINSMVAFLWPCIPSAPMQVLCLTLRVQYSDEVMIVFSVLFSLLILMLSHVAVHVSERGSSWQHMCVNHVHVSLTLPPSLDTGTSSNHTRHIKVWFILLKIIKLHVWLASRIRTSHSTPRELERRGIFHLHFTWIAREVCEH